MRQLTVLFSLLHLSSQAQNTNHYGAFPTIDHSGAISKKFDYSLYYFGGANLVNKRTDGIKEPANFFVFYSEQAFTFKQNDNLSFTGGYVYERQHPLANNYRNENRLYLQSSYKYNQRKTTLKHRVRYDGRFITNNITNETPYTSRIRYLTGIATPLQKRGGIYLNIYNEFFFNIYKSAPVVYSENWAYAGIGFKTEKIGTFEAGPLYIFWINNPQNDFSNFYYLQLTWITHTHL